jgi:hypothetical protein
VKTGDKPVKKISLFVASAFLLLSSSAFAEADFQEFWKKFKAAVVRGDKATVAQMTKFPLSMPAFQKNVRDQADLLRRYDEIFNGEANATRCFPTIQPKKQSPRLYDVYCPFKETPNDLENAPIRFYFERTSAGWKFTGLDNINE